MFTYSFIIKRSEYNLLGKDFVHSILTVVQEFDRSHFLIT